MIEVPEGSGRLRTDLGSLSALGADSAVNAPPAPRWTKQKAVRPGTHDPAALALVRRCILPIVVVLMLLGCLLIVRERLTIECWALALIAFLLSVLILSPPPLRRPEEASAPLERSASRLLLEWFSIALVLLFVAVAFKLTQILPREILLGWLIATPLALLVADAFTPRVERLIGGHAAAQRYVIIGANEVGAELARRIAQSHGCGQFCGFLDFRSAERVPTGLEKPVLTSCSAGELADYVRSQAITRVYLALPIATTPRIEELIRELRDTTATVSFVPNIFGFELLQARCVDINGMPVLSICDSPFHGTSEIWKRVFDLGLALGVLLLSWPVLLVVGAAIKLTSPGPVLFKQRRYGLHGEEILVYKFRTMTVCEDGPVVRQAVPSDRRVTRLGALLRRTSLDELPQIFNVLEGTMSFVGPRPHAVAHNEEYRKLISGYMMRHKVRPGITGWAQVNGLRGETRTVERMHRRVQYDLDYLNHWSLGLDLKIIVKTALIVLRDHNAF